MSELRPEDFFAEIVPVLERLEIPWVIAGALAAERYRSNPRVTTDADLLVRWSDRLPDKLRAAGWRLRISADPGEHPHLIRCQRANERVDLIVAGTDYQDEALRRAKDNVLTVEDVLVHKFIAGRPRDIGDIRSILEAGHEIDWAYVRRWADEFGVVERIDRALEE